MKHELHDSRNKQLSVHFIIKYHLIVKHNTIKGPEIATSSGLYLKLKTAGTQNEGQHRNKSTTTPQKVQTNLNKDATLIV